MWLGLKRYFVLLNFPVSPLTIFSVTKSDWFVILSFVVLFIFFLILSLLLIQDQISMLTDWGSELMLISPEFVLGWTFSIMVYRRNLCPIRRQGAMRTFWIDQFLNWVDAQSFLDQLIYLPLLGTLLGQDQIRYAMVAKSWSHNHHFIQALLTIR